MARDSKISWTHHTFNPWWGCTEISPGCAYCYARDFAKRCGFEVWDNETRRFFPNQKHWDEPLRWDAQAAAAGERHRVFSGSMCDVFEPLPALVPHRLRLLDLIRRTPNLDWLLVTKRPTFIVQSLICAARSIPACCTTLDDLIVWLTDWVIDKPPANVWLITTVENQCYIDRAHALATVPARVRGLSIEPQIGLVDLLGLKGLHWAIFGCESRPGGRLGRHCDLEWVRYGIEQCRVMGIAPFVKQLPIDNRLSTNPAEWPEDLRVQEYPS